MKTKISEFPLKNEWSTFGGRLKAARERAQLGQDSVAKYLIEKGSTKPTNRKTIGFWEILGSTKESTSTQMRMPHPNEILLLVELYKIDGLWLYLYERNPSLTIEPPDNAHSAFYGHPPPRTKEEIQFQQNLRNIKPHELEDFMRFCTILGMKL